MIKPISECSEMQKVAQTHNIHPQHKQLHTLYNVSSKFCQFVKGAKKPAVFQEVKHEQNFPSI